MNREIKFRVYTEIKHEWLGMKYFDLKDAQFNTNNTVMQYTGLKDKNGKEIYQGDLLKVTADKEGYGSTSYGGLVEVTTETCGYELKPIKPTFEEMEERGEPWDSSSMWHVCEEGSNGEGTTEIIGNIYEHGPELLS